MRLRLTMIIMIMTIFQCICKAALFASFLLIPPPPPPTLCHFLFLQNSRFFMPHTHTAIALLTSLDACVTHTAGGIGVLCFFGLMLLFGLIWCSCELIARKSRSPKKSEKIIEPTSAALNIEMTTASGGEAALPDTAAAHTYQSISQGTARVADNGEEVQVV
jgi:hypothetical protein